MTYRDLPYYVGMRAKTHRENKLHENKHANPLENVGPSLFYLVLINIGRFTIKTDLWVLCSLEVPFV